MALLRGAAVLALFCIAQAQSSSTSSKLQVHIPQTLSKSGGYDHREALFGVPPYGASLQQIMYYANSDLCDPNVDTRGGFPIRPLDKDGNMEPWPAPFILMLDRGGCTFVQKVRNAQRAGAAGVIIADNTCLCSSEAEGKCHSSPGEECESHEPIMADDGSGSDISIPSFLIFKQDADPIKAELMANHVVRIEMAWALPNPDDRVEYELWTTPTDVISREFQRQFKAAAVALDKHASFTPHMYIYDGIKSGCQDAGGENQCYNLCTNNGRYCATDPDNDLDRGISGANVVQEGLRRDCIWQIYGKENGIGVQWWDYVNEFLYRCDSEQYFANTDCVEDAMKRAQVDKQAVKNCMSDSGGLEADAKNQILEGELDAKEVTGVVILPAAFINSAAIRGALSFSTVFRAVCAGYVSGSEPSICTSCATCHDEYNCVVSGHCAGTTGAVSVPVFAASMAAIVVIFGCIGVIQWQRSQRQMRAQVRGILAEYMPLDENNKVESAGLDPDTEDGEFT